MFGAPKPTFGQSSTAGGFAFNNTATPSPFGQSAFGRQPTPGFGQTPAFGQQQNTSLFGTTGGTTGGLFGSTPAPAFGTTATTQQNSFGGGFGQQQQPQQTSLFGASANTSSNLFGQNANNSSFGSSSFGAFRQNQPQTSVFGQTAISNTATPGFGTGTSAFGQPATNTGGGMFGSTQPSAFGQPQMGSNGTANPKYTPQMGSDTFVKNGQSSSVNTKQHCITAMKEYEGKSLEELRLEDYMANRKGPQAGAPAGLFGAQPSTSSGIFGQPPATGVFAQQQDANKGVFGANSTIGTFGNNTNTFGAQNQQQNNLFGKPTFPATTSAFGFNQQPNNTATTSLFGANKPFGQTTNNMFGQAQQQPNTFAQPSTFGTFGQANTSQPSIFGNQTDKPAFGMTSSAPAQFSFNSTSTNTTGGGLFGNKPANGFGSNISSGFGMTAPTSTAPAFGTFGQNNQGNSLFKPTVQPFNSFGTGTAPTLGGGGGLNLGTNNQPSMFGNTANKPGGLFGNTNTQPTGLFGGPSNFGGTTGNSFGNTLGNTGLGSFNSNTLGTGQAPATVPIHQQILSMASSPYGDNPIFKDLKPSVTANEEALKPTNPAAQKAVLETSSYKVSPKVSDNIGLKVKPIRAIQNKKSLFGGLEENDNSIEESFSLKPNVKRLIIKPKSNASSSSFRLSLSAHNIDQTGIHNESINADKENVNTRNTIAQLPSGSDADSSRRVSWLQTNTLEKVRQQSKEILDSTSHDSSIQELIPDRHRGEGNMSLRTSSSFTSADAVGRTSGGIINRHHFGAHVSSDSINSGRSFLDETASNMSLVEPTAPHPTGITLRRAGYYTIPKLDELTVYMTEDGKCIVPNFTIGREGYGNVYFSQPIDVAGLNLDEIVHFRHKEVTIYPDDDNKPPVGSGLNRKAQITIDQVWPLDKALKEPIKDPERLAALDYEGKLRRVCDKHETRFIEYRPETGSWVFKVDHFSKYGLTESDEDEPVDAKKAKLTQQAIGKGKVDKISSGTIPKQTTENNLKKPNEDNRNILAVANRTLEKDGYEDTVDFEDDDEDDEEDDELMDFFLDPEPSSREALSPSATVAREMGINAHKLQLMKASFFNDDEYDTKSIGYGDRETPDQTVPNKPSYLNFQFNAYSSSSQTYSKGVPSVTGSSSIMNSEASPVTFAPTTHGDFEDMRQPLAKTFVPLVATPKVSNILNATSIVPLKESLLGRFNGKCISDIAMFQGRRFKVGWSHRNSVFGLTTLNHIHDFKSNLTSETMSLFVRRAESDKSKSIIQNYKIASLRNIENFDASIIDHLQIQLRNSEQLPSEFSDCPYFKPISGTLPLEAHSHLASKLKNISSMEKYAETVWSLCEALWGERDELEGFEANSHVTVMCRRDLLSAWFESILTGEDLENKRVTKSGYLDHMFELLTSHKVDKASELAFTHCDAEPVLGMLLGQISGGQTVRQLIQHQLSSWQEIEADTYIDPDRLKLYMLIAGVPLLASTHGAINVFDGLDWIKSLAIHLWYLCSPTSSITDVLIAYEQAFQTENFNAMPPLPPYLNEIDSKKICDIRFHLLKLFSKKSHSMEAILNPATHTSDALDYRLSWLLYQVLQSLGYQHCSERGSMHLHTSFASQLENYGLWEWAIFVLMHIENESQRELCIQQMLYKYIKIDDSSMEYVRKEQFIETRLGIPMKWIFWAKAVNAGALNNYHQQAEYLLFAEQWNEAHKVIMQHLAPDAIINDNIPYIRSLLEQIENSSDVYNWNIEGAILLDYIDLNEKFDTLKTIHEGDLESRWEGLKPHIADLSSRINLFPCPTSKHRLCQSEIAQRLSCLVRGVLIMCPDLNTCQLVKMALDRLPLPQEYAKQEVKVLLDTFFVDVVQRSGDHHMMVE